MAGSAQARRRETPELYPGVGQVDPGADDDLVAVGPQILDGAHAHDGAPRLAPALGPGPLGLDGTDLSIRPGAISLDHIALVVEASAEQVHEKRLCVAMEHSAGLHGRSLPRPCKATADGAHPRRGRPAARVTAELRLSPARRQVAEGVLAGLVERVTFHNPENGFCELRIKTRGQRDLVTVVDRAAMVDAGERITASGEWINDRTHGLQFRARFMRTSAPSSVEGIERYLGSGVILGIGPVYAGKLVRAFGNKVFEVIEAEPERLREVIGIGPMWTSASPTPGRSRRRSARSWCSSTAMASAPRGRCESSGPMAPPPWRS